MPTSIITRFSMMFMRPFTLSCALAFAICAIPVAALAQPGTPAPAAGTTTSALPNPLATAPKPASTPAAAPAAGAPTLTPLAQIPGAPAAPTVNAAAWMLVDMLSGQILASSNADDRREPASLTKLMTTYLVFQALRAKTIDLGQVVPVSENAWRTGGSRMFIEPRKPVTVDELLHGVIVQSGNDATVALAELIAGSTDAFVDRMNREAVKLGLTGTHYADVNGLPSPQHYSTANDIAKLTVALIRDFPEYYPIFAVKEYRYNNITQSNRNRLLWADPTVDGVKTGHTEAAGYCLVASAKRGERRLVAVVLGANTDAGRASESQKLLNWGFQSFDTVALYQSGKPVTTLRVWKGAKKDVNAGFLAARYVTLPKGDAAKLSLTMESREPLIAPVLASEPVGVVKVSLKGKPIAQFPLIALEDVPLANLFGRAVDTVRLWFSS
ncbi:MAG TPA: D-alanyl-D-alanine carboxypeptidase family protein, partial [Casimicrobiaceae bacterium]|nr:D-alanyl-D-alanine carboxypeptidase family protein [Casimicrobiaceae bacterium]